MTALSTLVVGERLHFKHKPNSKIHPVQRYIQYKYTSSWNIHLIQGYIQFRDTSNSSTHPVETYTQFKDTSGSRIRLIQGYIQFKYTSSWNIHQIQGYIRFKDTLNWRIHPVQGYTSFKDTLIHPVQGYIQFKNIFKMPTRAWKKKYTAFPTTMGVEQSACESDHMMPAFSLQCPSYKIQFITVCTFLPAITQCKLYGFTFTIPGSLHSSFRGYLSICLPHTEKVQSSTKIIRYATLFRNG